MSGAALGTDEELLAPQDGQEVTLDRIAGEWRIFQLKRGHRFSTDDMLTAWMAAALAPNATRLVDIGAGIGSVGIMTLFRLKVQENERGQEPLERRMVMVEAQEVSHRLCKRTLALNGLSGVVEARNGDLRDPAMLPEGAAQGFELVTGSPPYIPLGKGAVSPVPQRAACRMELRGSVFDYAATAKRVLAPGGWFVFVFAGGDPRAEEAVAAAGLHLRVRQDVYFRAKLAPTIALFAATHEEGPLETWEPFIIRDADGEWTDAYLQMRTAMGTNVERRPNGGGALRRDTGEES